MELCIICFVKVCILEISELALELKQETEYIGASIKCVPTCVRKDGACMNGWDDPRALTRCITLRGAYQFQKELRKKGFACLTKTWLKTGLVGDLLLTCPLWQFITFIPNYATFQTVFSGENEVSLIKYTVEPLFSTEIKKYHGLGTQTRTNGGQTSQGMVWNMLS